METQAITTTRALSVMIRGLEHLLAGTREQIPSQHLLLLMHVAAAGEVPQLDLIEKTGSSQSAVSRIVYDLGEGSPKEAGLGLLETYPDPEWRRRKLVRLTDKGRKLVNGLAPVLTAQLTRKAS